MQCSDQRERTKALIHILDILTLIDTTLKIKHLNKWNVVK